METFCFVQRVMIGIHLLLLSKAQGVQNIKSEIDHNSEASGRVGGDVRLGCVYKGSATVSQIIWAKETNHGLVNLATRQNDDTSFVFDGEFKQRVTFVGYGIKDGSITINNLSTSDSGTYICRFMTTSGNKEVKINLIVRGVQNIKSEIDHNSEASGRVGGDVRLGCVYKGSATVSQIIWAKETNHGLVNLATRQNDDTSFVFDGVQNIKSEIDHNSEASGRVGGDVRLGCVYKGSATVSQIIWAKETNHGLVNLATRQNDDTSFVFDGEFKQRVTFVGYGIKDGSITINNLSTSDSGTYICRFMTTSGNKEVKINLIVRGIQNIKSEIDHNSEASGRVGGDVRLGCVYKGSATVSQIIWAKETNHGLVNLATRQNDDTSFVFDGEFKQRVTFVGYGIKDGSITINNLSTSDSGTYICRFMTTSGNKEVKINLIVRGVQNIKSEIDHNSKASGRGGGDVRLGCVYKGSANVSQILWAKETNHGLMNLATRQNDDTSFHFDSEFSWRLTFVRYGIKDASITISKLSTSDSGTYICRFMTTSGNKEVKINLIVLGGGDCDGGDGGVEPWVIAIATIVPLTALVAAVGAVYCFWFRKKASPVTRTGQGEHSPQNAPRGTQQQRRHNDRTSLPRTTELQLDHLPYGSGTETFEYYNMPQELSSHRNRMQHLDERIMNSSETVGEFNLK
ncbi:immunoglobulin superfamily member 10-like isoform X2 [Lampetra planeri]